MEKKRKHLAILNLTGQLSPELSDYFSFRGILVVDPLKTNDEYDWTHIITKDLNDYSLINKTFEVSKTERQIISLSRVDDLQNFTINNGNLILDDCWFKTIMGSFIMDKYLQNSGGTKLSENYPTFKEVGSFNVANPFNTGEYVDQLVQVAFENEVNALAIRSYFDHLIMYISGLKTKGKAGLPFEVSYGVFEDVFAVQVHFYSPIVSIMDVTVCLNSMITKKPEEYYLNVAVQSSDFFDFSFLSDVKKVIVTALWTKDTRIKFENRGLMFTSLKGGLPLALFDNENAISSIKTSELVMNDFSHKVIIPDNLSEDSKNKLIKAFSTEDDALFTVSGLNKEDKGLIKISDSTEHDNEVKLIKGDSFLKEFVQNVHGKFDKNQATTSLAGNGLDVDRVVFHIASNIDETARDQNLKIRTTGEMLSPQIKKGLLNFAKEIKKPIDAIDSNELDKFQVEHIPEILKVELLKLHPEEDIREGGRPNQKMSEIESKLKIKDKENEMLKAQLKNLLTELKIVRDSRTKIINMQNKASEASSQSNLDERENDSDDELRNFYRQKLKTQKSINVNEADKLSSLLERETEMISHLRQVEQKSKKIEIESIQKESYFIQEMEKADRSLKMRDLSLLKTRESFKKLVDRKDREISELKDKTERLSRIANAGLNNTNSLRLKDLERQVLNLNKQIEIYRSKIATLSINKNSQKNESESKDDARKYLSVMQQLKNNLDILRKENERMHMKASRDQAEINLLKSEKTQFERQVSETPNDGDSSSKNENDKLPRNVLELKKLRIQNQTLETQVRDSSLKISNLENKLAEATKSQKATSSASEDGSKVRVTQLENSLKKLTQDLIDVRTQLAEVKKESNKLRQEKTALQNQVDRLAKDNAKGKFGAKKGKVA